MANRGRGRGRGAADVGAEMNDVQEDGQAALNQAVLGMNAAMQAMQNMMQQQAQMFQQMMAQNMAQQGAAQQVQQDQAAAGGGNQNPPPPHLTAEELQQERWMKTVERYKKLAPKAFEKGDAATAFNWLTDVERICNMMGVDNLVKRKLVASSLQGEAGQWYHMALTAEQEQYMTWEEFVDLFESHFISVAVKTEKMVELCRI